LSPQGEFSPASGMSRRTTGAGRRSKKTLCPRPKFGLMNSIHPAMQKSPLSAALRRGMITPIFL
jgi:hypothetical protein